MPGIRYNPDNSVTITDDAGVVVATLPAPVTQAQIDAALPTIPPTVEPAPEQVPAWAAKAALEEAGLLTAAEAAAEAQGVAWKWRFAAATVWVRSDVLALAAAAGLTEAQADDLLRQAAVLAG